MEFHFRCTFHECFLEGTPALQNPSTEATLVWTFNTHELQCATGKKGPFVNGCRRHWVAHVVMGPQSL